MKKNILLTGCAGFIGSHFVRTVACRQDIKKEYSFHIIDALTYAGNIENIQDLLNQHDHLSFQKADIRDSKTLQKIFEDKNYSGVINFAAETHVDRSIDHPGVFVETNVLGTLNLLKQSLGQFEKNSSFRYLQVSTDEVYGSLSSTEPAFTEKHMIQPNSPYSASKAGADLLVQSFFETYKLPTVITRCSNNYGSLQNEEKFIPTMIRKALKNEKLPIYGTGLNVRDWIYVDDHNEGIWKAFTVGQAGEVYNFGGDCERQNIDIARLILKKLDKPESLINFVEDRKGHDFRYAINFSKAQKDLNWTPKVSFDDGGLDTVIAAYKKLWGF